MVECDQTEVCSSADFSKQQMLLLKETALQTQEIFHF